MTYFVCSKIQEYANKIQIFEKNQTFIIIYALVDERVTAVFVK